jgi:hypothetical protein
VQMGCQMRCLQGRSPGALCQSRHATTEHHVDALDKGGVDVSRPAQGLQCLGEGGSSPQPDFLLDPQPPASSVALFDLVIEQSCHLPLFPLALRCLDLVSKVSSEGAEVGIEAIAGEDRRQKGGQLLAQAVDEQEGHAVSAWTQVERGNALGERINGDPKPEDVRVAAQQRAQFI